MALFNCKSEMICSLGCQCSVTNGKQINTSWPTLASIQHGTKLPHPIVRVCVRACARVCARELPRDSSAVVGTLFLFYPGCFICFTLHEASFFSFFLPFASIFFGLQPATKLQIDFFPPLISSFFAYTLSPSFYVLLFVPKPDGKFTLIDRDHV